VKHLQIFKLAIVAIVFGIGSVCFAGQTCSSEGVCIGQRYFRNGYKTTIIGINDSNSTYVTKDDGDVHSYEGRKKHELARMFGGCSQEGICIGQRYFRNSYKTTIIGINDSNSTYVTKDDGDVHSYEGRKKHELSQIADENYGFSGIALQGMGLESLEGLFDDLTKVSYSSKASLYTLAHKVLALFPYGYEVHNMKNANNYNLRIFVMNAVAPLIENTTSEVFEKNINPEFAKYKKAINDANEVSALADIPYTMQTRYASMYLMQAGLASVKGSVANLQVKSNLDRLTATLGQAMASKSKSDVAKVVGLYFQTSHSLDEVKVLSATRDIMLMVESLSEYLRVNVDGECTEGQR
jgi:hypothetical protein